MARLIFSASAKESKDKDIQFRVTTGLDIFKAATQKKNSMVMKTGYPIFKGKTLYAGIRMTFPGNTTLHHLLFSFSYASLISDDGLGHNYILQNGDSKFTCLQLEHQMQRNLFRVHALDVDFAPVAGIEYQKRYLIYHSQAELKTSDFNFFLAFQKQHPEYLLTPSQLLQETVDGEQVYYPNVGMWVHFAAETYGIEKLNQLFTVSRDHFIEKFETITQSSWSHMQSGYDQYLQGLKEIISEKITIGYDHDGIIEL